MEALYERMKRMLLRNGTRRESEAFPSADEHFYELPGYVIESLYRADGSSELRAWLSQGPYKRSITIYTYYMGQETIYENHAIELAELYDIIQRQQVLEDLADV